MTGALLRARSKSCLTRLSLLPRKLALTSAVVAARKPSPLSFARVRAICVFRLSELAAAIDRRDSSGYRRPPENERAYHPIIRRSLLK
jgi:hypothetical protein